MKRLSLLCAVASLLGCDGQTLVLGRAAIVTDGGDAPRDAGSPIQDATVGRDGGAQHENDDDQLMEGEDFTPCLRDLDCVGEDDHTHCDLDRLQCVECLLDRDCESGEHCIANEGVCKF